MDKIGIFDSGLGGLQVLKEIEKEIDVDIIYIADSKHFPYGNKNKEEIIEYAKSICDMLSTMGVSMIIIACGTATSYALDYLKHEYDIPIIGIIEPTCLYIKDKYDKVGIMATSATIRSNAWEENIKKYDKNIDVVNVACPKLATIIENSQKLTYDDMNEIKSYIDVLVNNKISNVILGCTHYPVVCDLLEDLFPYSVNLIDTGVIIAKYLKDNYKFSKNPKRKIKIFNTKDV